MRLTKHAIITNEIEAEKKVNRIKKKSGSAKFQRGSKFLGRCVLEKDLSESISKKLEVCVEGLNFK